MWNLNDSPDERKNYESEGCSIDGEEVDEKGKRVGSVSNSSSSVVVIEDGSEEEGNDNSNNSNSNGNGNGALLKKRSSKIFGFSMDESDDSPPVTRQFFPVEDSEVTAVVDSSPGGGGVVSSSFPRAHWVGVKFCQSETVNGGKSIEASSQPIKKSRRGPRSRSSQYRGVTFYRRTGRWESHIWLVTS